MALNRIKVWIKEVLYFADLNAEIDNIIENPVDLISPLTDTLDMNGKELTLDASGESAITTATTDVVDIEAQSFAVLKVDGATATCKNGITIASAATGDPALISVHGEADIGLEIHNDQAEPILKLAVTATAVNEITVTNAATGANPTIAATASDTDTDIGIDFENDQAEEMLVLGSVPTGVNHLIISNAATTANPTIACAGDESDIGITLQNQDDEPMLELDSVPTSTNWVKVSSAAGGADATITGGAAGADAGVTILGKGAGTLKLGDASLIFPDSDGAAANYIMVTDNSGPALSLSSNVIGAGDATTTVIPLPRAHLAGCQMTRTDANTITVSIGQARGGTAKDGANFDLANLPLATTLAKDIDTTWAAGAGGGLCDTDFASGGSDCEADTWYHVFLIEDGAGTVDVGFDQDIDCTELLDDSGYTNFRRIGSVLTDGAKDILAFTQVGDEFIFATLIDAGATTPTTDAHTALALSVPPDVNVLAVFNMDFDDDDQANASVSVYSGVGDQTGGGISTGYISLLIGGQTSDGTAGQFRLLTDTSKQIGYHASHTLDQFSVGVLGWIDRRGRDD